MKKSLLILLSILSLTSCSKKDDDSNIEKCEPPLNLYANHISPNSVRLSWDIPTFEPIESFIVEYGPEGFTPGSGTVVNTQDLSLTVSNLAAKTDYSFYVQRKCSNDIFSENAGPKNFTTTECNAIDGVSVFNVTETTAYITWATETKAAELEYGPTGFILGTGTKISINTPTFYYDLENLISSTIYDVYMRNVCETDYSPYSEVSTFTTLDICKKPERLRLISFGRNSLRITWDRGDNSSWQVEYGIQGFTLGTGRILNTSVSNPLIEEGIRPKTTYEFYVRANCGPDGYSKDAGPLVVTTQP